MRLLYILVGIITILLVLLILLKSIKRSPLTVVTAYYPVKKNTHGDAKYKEWMKLFFKNVTCNVICFCPPEKKEDIASMARSNVKLVARDSKSFSMMSDKQMAVWNKFYEIDPERETHSPELYSVWASKWEFVTEAIKMNDSDIYVWCDIGAFRTDRPGSFKNTYKYVVPNKITCLEIADTIGGGILAGDKDAWYGFSERYLKQLNKEPDGKEQNIYKKIINENNAVIIKPTDEYGDPWFYLTYIFA